MQQLLLALRSPAVAAEAAVAAHHAMARNNDCNRIAGAGAGHGAHCCRLVYGGGDLPVGASLAARNLAQGLPDLELKGRAADVEGNVRVRRLTIDDFHYLSRQMPDGSRILAQVGEWKFAVQVSDQRRRGIAEAHGA